MSVLEELRNLQSSGLTESQIVSALRDRGFNYKDISDALSQTKIKAAVESDEEPQIPLPPGSDEDSGLPDVDFPQEDSGQEGYPQEQENFPGNGMEQSIMQSQEFQPEMQEYTPVPSQEMPPSSFQQEMPQSFQGQQYPPQYDNSQQYQEYPDYSQEGYPQYEYQSGGISSDTIAEISEQILSEKVSEMRKHIEKALDFKNTMEAKVDHIDERIRRIEKIIDTLQSSVLRKVGDYVTNIEDIKREIQETQKSFAKLAPSRKERRPSKKKSNPHKRHAHH
jgi:hypothetical protein